jgi:hypothetical protein
MQKLARALTQKHKGSRLFEVRVVGWTSLRQRITDYPDLVRKYFPDFAPADVVEAIESGIEASKEEGAQTRALLQKGFTALEALVERGDAADSLRTRITDFAQLIEAGSIKAGLTGLERLWSTTSANATPRNRYLLRANIGFARLMLGDQASGVLELHAAAAEDPTWPNARAVLATAEMLDGNREAAFVMAKAALAEDQSGYQAARPCGRILES